MAVVLLAIALPAIDAAQAKPSSARQAAALIQSEAERTLQNQLGRFSAGHEGSRLDLLPCARSRLRRRPHSVRYVFRCTVVRFEGCTFVAADFSHFYTCENPRPYRLADEDRLSQEAGREVRVVPWWYDEMPAKAFESAGSGYLHPWCTGPGSMKLSVVDKPDDFGRSRFRLGPVRVYAPDRVERAPWRCPVGPFEEVR